MINLFETLIFTKQIITNLIGIFTLFLIIDAYFKRDKSFLNYILKTIVMEIAFLFQLFIIFYSLRYSEKDWNELAVLCSCFIFFTAIKRGTNLIDILKAVKNLTGEKLKKIGDFLSDKK